MVQGGVSAKLIAAKIACCGVLLLFLTGAVSLSGIAGWFRDGGLAWLAVAVAAALSGLFLWRRRRARLCASNDGVRRRETKGTP